jgi:acetyl-CoA carboxylase carboxyl transferase subunit alpha
LENEIKSMGKEMEKIKNEKLNNLSPWEKVLISRHPKRPSARDYIQYLISDWIELHGDRYYKDDAAIIGGIGLFNDIPVTVIGQQKGTDTRENIKRNFGMPSPEGYRKVLRLINQAEKFNRPVLTFINTPGAYPGMGAEERGQAWAISQNLMRFATLRVPVIAIIHGEGGSGGALALAVADRIFMLSHSIFSVASPEACASIIWKNSERADEMAVALKITAQDLLAQHNIDGIIEEPLGGAQADFEATAQAIKVQIEKSLQEIIDLDRDELVEKRLEKFRKIGQFNE